MDQDTLMNVGPFCDGLLGDPTFQFLTGYYEANLAAQLLSTQPHETKLRESIFARVLAQREFSAMLKDLAQQYHDLIKPKDQTDLIDDQSVHNIHKDYD